MDASSLWPVFVAALAVFGIAFAAMAVGVMLTGRRLRGSCGGSNVCGPDGESLSCATCPNRGKHHAHAGGG